MSTTYAQKQAPAQKKDSPSAASVLDASSQKEGLQRKADMANNAAQREETPQSNKAVMQMLKNKNPFIGSISQRDSDFYYLTYKILRGYGFIDTEIRTTQERMKAIIESNPNLEKWYEDAAGQIGSATIEGVERAALKHGFAQIDFNPRNGRARISYERRSKEVSPDMLCILVLHELMHFDTAKKYQSFKRIPIKDGFPSQIALFASSHLVTDSDQTESELINSNAARLYDLWEREKITIAGLDPEISKWIKDRIVYMNVSEYDTVLGDVVYYMIRHNLTHVKTFYFANKLLAEANERRNNPGQAARVLKPKKHFWQFWR